MAITHNDVQVTWPTASNTSTITSASNDTSEAVTINATAIDGMIHAKADNQGTPASGDTVDFYILYTGGDPDGASTDEYDSADIDTAILLGSLDTYNGPDPCLKSFPILTAAKGFKIFAVNNGASSVIVSCGYTEVRG